MSRTDLLNDLRIYETTWLNSPVTISLDALKGDQRRSLRDIEKFIATEPCCFERQCPTGHLTGSALLTVPKLDRVCLMLHRKLGKWLQLGGHADGDCDLGAVAMKEAKEESGLKAIDYFQSALPPAREGSKPHGAVRSFHRPEVRALFTGIFDVDCHVIPGRGIEQEHMHYDVRFLLYTTTPDQLICNDESDDLRWFTTDEARQLTPEVSIHRQLAKLDFLRDLRDGRV